MPTNDRLSELRTQLKTELEKSFIIDQEDKDFWLSNLDQLPAPTIQNLLDKITPKNALVDSYIDTALAQDQNQEHLKSLKADLNRIKQHAFQLEEGSQSGEKQAQEEELLKKLDEV